MKKIALIPNDKGILLRDTKNAEYKQIQIQQTKFDIDPLTGMVRNRTRSAFITVQSAVAGDYLAMLKEPGALDGEIYRHEFVQSAVPDAYKKNDTDWETYRLKRADDSDDAPVHIKNGEQVYMFHMYVSAAQAKARPELAQDILVTSDNIEDISEYRRLLREEIAEANKNAAPAATTGKGANRKKLAGGALAGN